MLKCCNYKYISVIVNIFSGWVEACPYRNADAVTVTKKLLRQCLILEYPLYYTATGGLSSQDKLSRGSVKPWEYNSIYTVELLKGRILFKKYTGQNL